MIADKVKNWRAIYVSSRTEKKIGETLIGKGIEAYVPLVKTMRQWSDRKKMVELPLLNGYVFVKTDLNENDKVMQTKGVVNFVRSEGKIATIRDIEIDRLKQLVELGYHLEANGINKIYKEGDKVKITSGVLKGIEGFVVDVGENKQIEVLLESIGQCIRVKLPNELLISL
jgi:transcription antitermination factor NusG